MLWVIRARMKPAFTIIEMIPNVHRGPALVALRKAALDGNTSTLRLSTEEKELAFYDGHVALVSPIGARLLGALYREGRIKLKKPAVAKLPALDAYIATEAAFRADVAALEAEEGIRRQRLARIIEDPSCATAGELDAALIDKVMTARLGHNVFGTLEIGGTLCHRTLVMPPDAAVMQTRPEGRVLCWWVDADGHRHGDTE